ncbi:MAG: PAS domain S-box protein [Panacibacter sp.]
MDEHKKFKETNFADSAKSALLPSWLKYSTNNTYVLFELQGNICDSNSTASDLLVSGDETNIKRCFSDAELPELQRLIDSLNVSNNTPAHFISQHENGNYYQWEFMLFDPVHVIGIAQEQNKISKKAESLFHIDHLIDSFMNNCPTSAWICDAGGRVLSMNKYFQSFIGLTDADIGKTLWEIYPEYLAELYHRNNNIVFSTNEILRVEEIGINTDGETRNFLTYKFPIKTIDGKTLIGGWAIDITERKIAEQKIFEHDLKLKELTFLQSHEVRRPLANILGLIELIKADSHKIEDEHFNNVLLYIQLSATDLDNEIRRVIDKLQEE